MFCRIIVTVFLVFLTACLWSQSTYNEAIAQGDKALQKGQYKKAINKYFAAEAFDPTKSSEVQNKINIAFDRIEALRRQAQQAEEKAKNSLKALKESNQKVEEALKKSKRLVKAFYFYEDRFALARKDDEYYFIDKNGNEVSKLRRWGEAEQFDERTGFAKVSEEGRSTEYLLDTLGNIYPLAKNIFNIDESHRAIIFKEEQDKFDPLDLKNIEIVIVDDLNFKTRDLLEALSENVKQIIILSGTLSPILARFSKFQKLEKLVLSSFVESQIPAEFFSLTNLIHLDLSSCAIEILPNKFSNFQKLKYLNLDGNGLSSLPESFGKLTELEQLNLDFNSIDKLPNSFSQLSNLKILNLSSNNLTELPDKLGDLGSLEVLNLESNDILNFPSNLCDLLSLKYLALNLYNLENFPDCIGSLETLETVILGGVSDKFADDICNFKGVKKIDIAFSDLTFIPDCIGGLYDLEYLDLAGNMIKSLPDEFGRLENLEYLDLSTNPISQLPESFGQLQNLRELYFEHSDDSSEAIRLSELPKSFSKLSNLEMLYMSNNQLKSVPFGFHDLKSLNYIDLSGNLISKFPETKEINSRLRLIKLGDNQLESIPEDIQNLKILNTINLSGNNLKTIPLSVVNLESLTDIDLSNNEIETIEGVNFSNKLSALNLSYNNIESANSLKGLDKLRELNLSHNQLDEIPEFVPYFISLIELDLSHNLIQRFNEKRAKKSDYEVPTLDEIFYKYGSKYNALQYLNLNFNKLDSIDINLIGSNRLFKLFLQGNELKSFVSDSSKVSRLQFLYISNNQLKSFPNSIRYAKNLIELSIGGNEIKTIPKSIYALDRLKKLYLNDNNIKEFPSGNTSLTNIGAIDLTNNNLENFPNAIFQFESLLDLYLGQNSIEVIPDKFELLPNLETLTLFENNIDKLPPSVLKCRELSLVNVGNNNVSELADTIFGMPFIKNIFINGNPNVDFMNAIQQIRDRDKGVQLATNYERRNFDDNVIQLIFDVTQFDLEQYSEYVEEEPDPEIKIQKYAEAFLAMNGGIRLDESSELRKIRIKLMENLALKILKYEEHEVFKDLILWYKILYAAYQLDDKDYAQSDSTLVDIQHRNLRWIDEIRLKNLDNLFAPFENTKDELNRKFDFLFSLTYAKLCFLIEDQERTSLYISKSKEIGIDNVNLNSLIVLNYLQNGEIESALSNFYSTLDLSKNSELRSAFQESFYSLLQSSDYTNRFNNDILKIIQEFKNAFEKG